MFFCYSSGVSFGFFFMNDDFEGLEYNIALASEVNRFLLDVHQRTAEARRDLLRRGCIGKALSPVLAAAATCLPPPAPHRLKLAVFTTAQW